MSTGEKPRAVMFDVDGTLSVSKQNVSNEMGEALAELLALVPVAIISGGSYAQFQKQVLPGIPATAALQNLYLYPVSSSSCYRYENGAWQVVYDHAFTQEERAQVLAAIDEALEEVHMETPAQIWGERIEDRGSQITFSGLGQSAPIEEKEKWDPERKKREPLQKALEAKLPEFTIRTNATSSIDITRKGLDKAHGVRAFSEITTIAISDMLYIGDALFQGGNDEIVCETGIPTHQVLNPLDTIAVIRDIVRS